MISPASGRQKLYLLSKSFQFRPRCPHLRGIKVRKVRLLLSTRVYKIRNDDCCKERLILVTCHVYFNHRWRPDVALVV